MPRKRKKRKKKSKRPKLPAEGRRGRIGTPLTSHGFELYGRPFKPPTRMGGYMNPIRIKIPSYAQRGRMLGGPTFIPGRVLAQGRLNAVQNAIRFGGALPLNIAQVQEIMADAGQYRRINGFMRDDPARLEIWADRRRAQAPPREPDVQPVAAEEPAEAPAPPAPLPPAPLQGVPIVEGVPMAEPVFDDELEEFRQAAQPLPPSDVERMVERPDLQDWDAIREGVGKPKGPPRGPPRGPEDWGGEQRDREGAGYNPPTRTGQRATTMEQRPGPDQQGEGQFAGQDDPRDIERDPAWTPPPSPRSPPQIRRTTRQTEADRIMEQALSGAPQEIDRRDHRPRRPREPLTTEIYEPQGDGYETPDDADDDDYYPPQKQHGIEHWQDWWKDQEGRDEMADQYADFGGSSGRWGGGSFNEQRHTVDTGNPMMQTWKDLGIYPEDRDAYQFFDSGGRVGLRVPAPRMAF